MGTRIEIFFRVQAHKNTVLGRIGLAKFEIDEPGLPRKRTFDAGRCVEALSYLLDQDSVEVLHHRTVQTKDEAQATTPGE